MTARKLSGGNVTSLARERISDAERETRVDLAACYRLVAHFGYDDVIWNHISARIPGEESFLINPWGLRYDEITASNLVKVDLEGKVIGGGETNATGFVIHSAVHRRRPDVQCVLHTHTEGGLGVSALAEGLIPLVQDATMFHGRIAYHAYEGLSTDLDERERLLAEADATALDTSHVLLEYFPSLRSPYTAISFRRTMDMVKRTGVQLQIKPVMPMMMRGVPAPPCGNEARTCVSGMRSPPPQAAAGRR